MLSQVTTHPQQTLTTNKNNNNNYNNYYNNNNNKPLSLVVNSCVFSQEK